MTQEREVFEAWAKNRAHPFHDREPLLNGSIDRYSDIAWQAWNARASLAQPASVPAGRSQLTAVDAAKLSGLMHDAAIRYADGYTVNFDDEASDFLVGAAPQPAQADQSPAEVHDARALIEQCRDALAEELAAWDIDPPLHHVKTAHDACVAWLESQAQPKGTDLILNDQAVQKRLAAQWGYVQAPAPGDEKAAWVPYLSDRADGVEGHYAIARWNPAGYREVWNLRSHRWASASDDVLCLEEADSLLSQIVIPTVKSAPVPQAFTEGHCVEKRKPGGCQLHNLHCGYPACDRKAAAPSPAVQDGKEQP